MRVLLTGASGNVGRNALRALVDDGHYVRALVLPGESVPKPFRVHPQVELFTGDLRDAARMREAARDQDAILHVAYIIPPLSNEKPDLARAVNVDGTRNLIAAAQVQPVPPRFLFVSTFDLFGVTAHLEPPRRATDPVVASDPYTEHKLQSERDVQASGLTWTILRFTDVPVIGLRMPHPMMYWFMPSQRFHVLHPKDAARALANALVCEEVWGRIWLIGGGDDCRVTFGQFVNSILEEYGIGALPDEAFSQEPYMMDWVDTSESQRVLQYQRHTFADVLADIRAVVGWRRHLLSAIRPLARWYVLRMSPYYGKRKSF